MQANLDGLSVLSNLVNLKISDKVVDLVPLNALPHLKKLALVVDLSVDLSPLQNNVCLKNIAILAISNRIDLSSLQKLKIIPFPEIKIINLTCDHLHL
jgi:hypothetical protein